MFRKKFFILGVLALCIALLAAPSLAGIQGSGVSGIQIQNLSSTDSAKVVVSLYPQSGGNPTTLAERTVAPASATNYYMPSLSVSDGSYSMVASADKPVAAIARTDWAASGGAAIYSSIAPGKLVLIPLILQNFAGQTSQFSIQNASGTQATDISIKVIGRGSSTVVKELTNQTLAANASRSYNLGDIGTFGTLPNTGTDLGATGFVGLILIESARDLVAQSFVDIAGTPGVGGFNGIPGTSASQTLYCPLARANYYGDTGIQIVNSNNTAANITITFRSDPLSPNGGTFTQNMTIPANSSDIAFQGPGGNSRSAPTNLPGGTQTPANTVLTNNGWFGNATLTSNVPVVAVVNDTEFGANYSVRGQGTYNCVASSGVGKVHYLPLLRNRHLAAEQLTTGVQVMNVTNVAGSVSLNLTNWDGTNAPDPANQNAAANGGVNFYGSTWAGLPTVPANLGGSGWFGSGVITCQQDCIVLVDDGNFPGASKLVDRANYIGITQ
ncbi:MAG: hypothetical protein KF893_22520 [Caldilineaceae bacterium]|nr:hypothetical protein [Caldilineaceae bacterium]